MSTAVDVVTSAQVGNLTIEVVLDEDGFSENPREWDNRAKFALRHPRYSIGDESEKAWFDDCHSVEEVEKHFADEGIEFFVPISMYDHSGTVLFIGTRDNWAVDAQWDVSEIGFAYIPQELFKNEFGGDIEKATACVKSEMDTYSAWMNGEVYVFQIKDADGEVLDSCGGFIGEPEYALASGVEDAKLRNS